MTSHAIRSFAAAAAMILLANGSAGAQEIIAPPRTTLYARLPKPVESVVFEGATRSASLGGAVVNRSLFFVNLAWNDPVPQVTSQSGVNLGSKNWVPGSYRVRFELRGTLPMATVSRYWYVGSTRQVEACQFQVDDLGMVCELPFTVTSAEQDFWFEVRSNIPNHSFQTTMRMTVTRYDQ
jgi:hypothetical protein